MSKLNDDKFIRADKCVVGNTYYLSGEWYELSTSTPIINTPVKFLGKGTNSNVGKFWADHRGKHHFEVIVDIGETIKSGEILKAYSGTEFLEEPIKNPEILRNNIKY